MGVLVVGGLQNNIPFYHYFFIFMMMKQNMQIKLDLILCCRCFRTDINGYECYDGMQIK